MSADTKHSFEKPMADKATDKSTEAQKAPARDDKMSPSTDLEKKADTTDKSQASKSEAPGKVDPAQAHKN